MRQNDKRAVERYLAKLSLIRSAANVNPNETEAEKKARIERAKKDVAFMVQYYFPHYATSPCSYFQIEFANMVKRDKTFKGFAQWGRAQAKSVWNSIIIPFWLWINEEPIYYVLVGSSGDRAAQLLDDLRAEFEANPRIIADFGEQQQLGTWETGFFITKGGFIGQALGMGQSVRGLRVKNKRPTHINPDDIETKDLVKNPKRQNEIVRWIEKDLIPTMDGDYRRYVHSNNKFAPRMVQTILQERHPKWKIHQVNAFNPVTFEPTWHQKYNSQYFKDIVDDIGILAANSEYNNSPHVEGELFKEEDIQWGKLPNLNHMKFIVGHWDVAYAGTPTSDYNAVRVWGLKDKTFYYINSFVRQSKMRAAIEWMCDFQSQLPPSVSILWQYEAQFWNDEVERTIKEVQKAAGINLNIIRVNTPKINKYSRILSLHPKYQNSRIVYNEKLKSHNDTQIGIAQLLGIEPGYKTNDDAPDADEQAITTLEKHIPDTSRSNSFFTGKMTHNNSRI